MHASGPGQASGADQEQLGRNRQADLLGEHDAEDDGVAILDQEVGRTVHGAVLSPGRRRPRFGCQPHRAPGGHHNIVVDAGLRNFLGCVEGSPGSPKT